MIHIADYTFHPEHYIRNRRKVSAREYDAHGHYFKTEAARISKESGYKITKFVTKAEMNMSRLSDKAINYIKNRKSIAIICVVYGTSGMNFYFKTDIYKLKDMKNVINSYTFYQIGSIRKIKYYTFDNKTLAEMRSCDKRLRGWFLNNENMLKKLQSIKATDYILN